MQYNKKIKKLDLQDLGQKEKKSWLSRISTIKKRKFENGWIKEGKWGREKKGVKDIVLKDKKSNLSSKGDYHCICIKGGSRPICIKGVQDLLELREDEPKCKVKKKAAIDILFQEASYIHSALIAGMQVFQHGHLFLLQHVVHAQMITLAHMLL